MKIEATTWEVCPSVISHSKRVELWKVIPAKRAATRDRHHRPASQAAAAPAAQSMKIMNTVNPAGQPRILRKT